MDTIQKSNIEDSLLRTHMAKMIAEYAVSILHKTPLAGMQCAFSDMNKQSDEMKYYAPFTSPKAKHRKMKNGKDFRKIQGGEYGAINFNNMIPVPDCALKLIDIDNESDQKYRRLLQNQYRAIRADSEEIIKTAAR